MKKLLKCMLVTSMISMLAFQGVSFSQEETAEEDMNATYGTVVEVSGDSVIISEYNYETDELVNVTYHVAEDAEMENLESFAELEEGSDVDIEFVELDGKNVIKYIYVYVDEEEES
ncbi:MAG: hypothetical protein ABH869_00350 [Candidatus Omnitrophota bacterium]